MSYVLSVWKYNPKYNFPVSMSLPLQVGGGADHLPETIHSTVFDPSSSKSLLQEKRQVEPTMKSPLSWEQSRLPWSGATIPGHLMAGVSNEKVPIPYLLRPSVFHIVYPFSGWQIAIDSLLHLGAFCWVTGISQCIKQDYFRKDRQVGLQKEV